MRDFRSNNIASAVPVILFVMTIVSCGALYTLLFLQFGIGYFGDMVPASDSKTFILTVIYAMPILILVVGVVSLIRAGLKREVY